MLALNERYRPKKLDDSRRGTVRPPDAAMIPGFLVAFSPARSGDGDATAKLSGQMTKRRRYRVAMLRVAAVSAIFLWAEGSAAKDESLGPEPDAAITPEPLAPASSGDLCQKAEWPDRVAKLPRSLKIFRRV